MCKVKRVRNLAQKVANLFRKLMFYFAASTDAQDERENNNNDKCLV